ncbi:hypothetical protein [Methylocucumis oryzae]|uniref:Filamentous haemagglutinin FhaB/tRNA nuclease CdiA-like TPS domain-containing protein n=1 Tax=Methylocucumis oryzae TaxID=1632867 RepID=A0A0F3IL42_9GAMM|nr:hypothetical protein [Methylocucumis oryzae]KJV07436.1 hypothetical protein VZ94_04720 [Methylocucumis oryzae]
MLANSAASAPDSVSIGGAVNFIADAIDFNANVLMPSGSLGLTALKNAIHVGESSNINLAGVGVTFADKIVYTPGGSFSATANQGQITLAEGSLVDISSGGGNASGGQLTLKALQKNVELLGSIKAVKGSAEIDVASYSANADFNSLMNTLTTAGISDQLYFRVRQDDIEQATGQLIKANRITLVSDTGSIKLAGTVNADNSGEAGKIQLYAGDNIVLADGARLTAQGATGGKVLLASVDSDNDGTSGIRLQQGSEINVSGSDDASGGQVILRALRTDEGINIDALEGKVTGYAQQAAEIKDGQVVTQGYSAFYAEGVKKYDTAAIDALSASTGEINANVINQINADTDAYMTAAMMNKVNNALGQGIRLRAAVQIDYKGDLASIVVGILPMRMITNRLTRACVRYRVS